MANDGSTKIVVRGAPREIATLRSEPSATASGDPASGLLAAADVWNLDERVQDTVKAGDAEQYIILEIGPRKADHTLPRVDS